MKTKPKNVRPGELPPLHNYQNLKMNCMRIPTRHASLIIEFAGIMSPKKVFLKLWFQGKESVWILLGRMISNFL